ncbi:MAG: hypothetical protein JWR53_535 [Glaciihabitans sp.]|jgi:hypothetical protein|nr:hypothetical protein [Glaciihabitans sp.]
MPSEPTVKQEREARRQAKVAVLKQQQAREKRNRRIGIIVGSVAAVAVIAVIITFVVTGSQPKPDPATVSIKGLKTFPGITAVHVDGTPVDYKKDYGMDPPAGGNHWSGWLNCGVYNQPQQNERAVHDLEHGALWLTYDPTKVDASAVATLIKKVPSTYMTISPYPGLPAPVVISAWGAQVQLTGVNDSRLAQFVTKYWRSSAAPEPTSPCTGGVDGPGKVG